MLAPSALRPLPNAKDTAQRIPLERCSLPYISTDHPLARMTSHPSDLREVRTGLRRRRRESRSQRVPREVLSIEAHALGRLLYDERYRSAREALRSDSTPPIDSSKNRAWAIFDTSSHARNARTGQSTPGAACTGTSAPSPS